MTATRWARLGPVAESPPAFEPSAPVRRGRLALVIGVVVVLALLGSSMVNLGRFALKCEDGRLVAHRGLAFPVGSRHLDPDLYPPVSVPDAQCVDTDLPSRAALDAAYT